MKKHLHTQKLRLIIVLLISSTICIQAYSEQQDTNEPEDLFDMSIEELMNIEVVTASKKLEKISDAPATVLVITKQEIRDRGYSNLKDVLHDLPGMEAIDYYFSEIGTLVPIRGVVGNNKIIILVNGMKVNPPGGEEFLLRGDFSVRYAERIEVIYGPGSTLYGQDAISAVINVITQQPAEQLSGEVLGALGTEDHSEGFFALSDTIETEIGTLGISGYLQYQDADPEDFSASYPNWWQNYRDVAEPIGEGLTSKRWDKGWNGLVRLQTENASLQFWHRESSRSTAEGGYTPVIFFVDEAIWHDRSTVVEGQHNLPISDNVSLESTLTFNRYEIDPESRYVWPMSATAFFYDDWEYGVGTSYTLEEKLHWDVTERLSVLAGIVLAYYDIIPKATIPGGADRDGDIVSQGGAFTYYTVQGDPSSRVDLPRAYNLIYQNYGFYIEGHYNATERLRLITGVRMDTNTRYSEKPVSPRFAAVYHLRDNLTAKYIYTQAYVAPSPYFGHNIYDNGTTMNIANPDLEPEKATSHEINLTYTHKNFSCGTSLYLNKQDNLLIIGDFASTIGQVWIDEAGTTSRLLTQSINSGQSEAKGVDSYLRYNWKNLSLWGSYSYVDYESKLLGQTTGLSGISTHNTRVGVTYKPQKKLTATLSAAFRSTPENITNKYSLDDELKDPYVLNLHVNYNLNERTRA